MITVEQIREKLSLFLAGKIIWWELDSWLDEKSWNMHQGSEQAAINLVYDLQLPVMEFQRQSLDGEYWCTEKMMIERIRDVAKREMSWPPAGLTVTLSRTR